MLYFKKPFLSNVFHIEQLEAAGGASPSLNSTFGWARLGVVGSLSCLIFFFSLSFATFMEAAQTLFHVGHLDAMHK